MSREEEQVEEQGQGLRDLMQGKCGGQIRAGKEHSNMEVKQRKQT